MGRETLFLLRELVKRDVKSRYAGSVLGFVWAMLHPMWQLTLFTFVFSWLLQFRLRGELTENFAIFLFCGLLPWLAISEAVARSTTAITDNADLVKKLRFPAEVLIFAIVLGALIHSGIAALVFLGVLAFMGQLSLGGLPLLLIALPLQLALTVGLGLLLAPAHVYFRDTGQLVGMVLNAWFYLTPIVYSLQLIPEKYQHWLALNPLSGLVGLYRAALLQGNLTLVSGLPSLLACGLVALGAGVWLFRKTRPHLADQI